jgi:hypothetical protein
VPGIVLSQPQSATTASKQFPRATSSMESAMTSRLIGAHPDAAHRDSVRDRNGVELHRRAAGLANALLHVFGQAAQVVIAGADLDPRVRHAHDRLLQRVVVEADGLEHRASAGAMRPFSDGAAVALVQGNRCRHAPCLATALSRLFQLG